MQSDKREQTAVNASGTASRSDARLTQHRSWIVRDKGDKPWGPFDSAGAAIDWATKKWPDVAQYSEGLDPDDCWEPVALWKPD